MSNWPKPSPRFAEYVRKMSACGHWTFTGKTGTDKAILEHDGVTVAYQLHDGGNDWNGPRNFAAEAQRICGCRLIEHRGRKRSRKNFRDVDDQVEAQRKRYRAEAERRHTETRWVNLRTRFLEARERGDRAVAADALRGIQAELAAHGLTYQEWDRAVVSRLHQA